MTHRIAAAIARALREQPTDEVHIHVGAHGRLYVCENPDCTSPGIASYDT